MLILRKCTHLGVCRRTAETFRDGWVYTGDEVVINEKMEVFVKDRIKVRLTHTFSFVDRY